MALRSTRKEVINAIREHISTDVQLHAEENRENVPKTFEDSAVYLARVFAIEMLKHDKRCKMSIYDYFEEWLQGGALYGLGNYYVHCSAIDLLNSWLFFTDEERGKLTESKAEKRITQLIFREVTKVPQARNIIIEELLKKYPQY